MAGEPLEILSGSVLCNYRLQDGLIILGSYYYGGERRVCFACYSSAFSGWRGASTGSGTGFRSLELKDGTLHFTVEVPFDATEVDVCIIKTDNFPTT
ncbi:hypothetical protein [Butyricicoccus sp. AM05-1]|jgi:hypothetical protein|uniref:hypothetical protein n=1 Tax=Butyricicoccus sp. AM05-1 TaxID=2292004 RepID=UPI001A9A451C|nr:hypothetical protein [Butyricicoccus sp. AM05-1]